MKSYFFAENRKKFLEKVKNKSIAVFFSKDKIIKGDSQFFDFCDVNLFYLTGIEQSETRLILYKDDLGKIHETLYILKADKKMIVWEGKKLSLMAASKISGINNVKYETDFETDFERILTNCEYFYHYEEKELEMPSKELEKLINEIKAEKKIEIENYYEILKDLRQKKNTQEIALMKKAAQITAKGFNKMLTEIKNCESEKDIEALLSYEYTKGFCRHAYEPIVASGKDACILHYTKNDKKLKKGELVLIDSGAEYSNYKIDVTRTFPISGKFTDRQKEVYQACLDVQKFAIKTLKVGVEKRVWERDVHMKMARELFKIGLLSKKETEEINNAYKANNGKISQSKAFKKLKGYYPHSTGHFLGLDTHDIGDYKIDFKEGDVFTVEPGIYIAKEKLGVRIEDDVLITKTGNVVLTKAIPKEIEDIERVMN